MYYTLFSLNFILLYYKKVKSHSFFVQTSNVTSPFVILYDDR